VKERWRSIFGYVPVNLSNGGGNPDETAGWINRGFSPKYKAGSARVTNNGDLIAKRYFIRGGVKI
jgi:hypothetical protein